MEPNKMPRTFVMFMSGWLRAYNFILLFGLFYGFLSTLPLSLPHIYFTRSFILEHDARKRSELRKKYIGPEKRFRVSESQVIFSGSLLAQAIVFLSIYCAPISGAFFKPHAMLFLALPIVFGILYRFINDISSSRIYLLLMGIVLQLMNPLLFFSDSAFPRLINLFLFRYTENLVFVISVFLGWLSGQILFLKLATFFCLRIEYDSALFGSRYSRSKRYIRETFRILFFAYFFLFCFGGNTTTPPFTKRFNEQLFGEEVLVEPFYTVQESIQELREKEKGKKTRVRLSTKSGDKRMFKKKEPPILVQIDNATAIKDTEDDEVQEGSNTTKEPKPYPVECLISPWVGKTWPNIFYDYRRWNWPLRYIEVEPENIVQGHFLGLLKTEVSDYFFDTCISDGRRRLCFTYPPSARFSAKMIRQKMAFFLGHSGSEMNCPNEDRVDKWNVAKANRRDYLGRELEDRVKALSKGSPILDVVEKRVKFSTESGTCLPEIEDPFLSGPFRGIMEHSRSAWIPLSKKISDEDILVQELSERLREQPSTPEEEKKTTLTIEEIQSILELIKKNKTLEETRTKLLKAKEIRFLVKTVMNKLKKLIRFSKKLCLFFDEKKLPFLEKHGKNERISNTPEEAQIYAQREDEDIIQIMDELIFEFSLFIKKNEKKNSNITDRNLIDNLKEGSLSGKNALGHLMDKFFFLVDKKLSFLEESEKNEQISDQEKEDLEKGISAHMLFFPENKKVKSIFKFWLPLFDPFRKRKVGLKKLEKSVISERKVERALDPNIHALFNKIFLNEFKLSEIKRDVPFWASKLLTGPYDDFGKEKDLDVSTPEVRSALVLDPQGEDIRIVSWIWETDDDRKMVKGSMRAQRRNLNTWMLMDLYVRSSFFVRYSEMGVKSEEIKRKSKRKANFYVKANWLKPSRRRLRKMYRSFLTRAEENRLEELTWMDEELMQLIRSFCLITLLYIRKYILVPSFVITKSIVRTFLFQFPEWKEDWDDWTKEMYVICDYDGVEYSETQYPEDFWEIGIQIKILSPFRFKPWREEHSGGDAGYLTMNPIVLTEQPFSDAAHDSENKRREDLFQVLWEDFLGPIRRFWGPRIKELIARIKELIRPAIEHIKKFIRLMNFLIWQVIGHIKEWIKKIKLDTWIEYIKELIGQLIERIKKFIRYLKELIERAIERIKKLIGRAMKRIKWIKESELQPGNKSIESLELNDRVTSQLQIKTKPRVEDKSVIETRLNVKERNEEIQQIREKYLLNLDIRAELKKEIDQYSHDIGSRLKNKPEFKNRIREINARRRGVRFNNDRNSRYFKKLYLRRKLLVINFKLSIIHLNNSILEFFDLSKRKIAAIIDNISNTKWTTEKTQDFKAGPAEISQAYVFHKMWQIRTTNKSYAKDLLKYRTSSPLIKKNIKELLDTQGILESKQPQDLRTNKWTQWLKFCYGYRVAKTKSSLFSQIWSRIAPKKRINRHQWSKREFESFIGMLQKWNKRYRYDLLASNYLSYEKEHIHRPLVQDMAVRNIPDHPNTNKKTRKSLVSNFFALDKSDLKLGKAKLDRTELNKSDDKHENDKESDQRGEKKGKGVIGKKRNLYYVDIFAHEIKTDQINEIETDQSFSESNLKPKESKTDINQKEDESLLIEFLDGYKFLKSYWFFPIFAENLELSEVIQTIRSDITPLIEYCQMHLPVDQYLSELNSYYFELCKERHKEVKDHDKINEIRNNLNRLNVSLDKLSPHMDNFMKKAYAKSDLKLPWLKPDVSLKLVVKKKKISKKPLEEETKQLVPEKTEATPEETRTTLEETEATPETKIQMIREEISKLIREEAEQVLKQPTIEENEIQAECKAFYEVPLRDYLRQADHTIFIPLNKVMEKARLTKEITTYKKKLAEAIDAFHSISTKREGMSESDFWRSALWENLNNIMNEVAELDGFPTIQMNKLHTLRIVFTDLKTAIGKQPKKQRNEEERDDNDKKAYNELKFQLEPKEGDTKNVGIQANRIGAKMNTEHISRNGSVPLLKEELWFLYQYEYIVNTLDFLLYSESNKSEDKSESNEVETAEKVHENKRKVHKERPLSTRAIRQVQKICNRNDATDVVTFLHTFYSKKYPEILELEHLIKEKHVYRYVMNCLSFHDCSNYWALLGCYDDRSLIDQMLFNMWLDPLVCLSPVLRDIKVLKLNTKFREGLYVDLSDRSVRRILNEKVSSSLIFEDILLPRRRREFRILNRFNLENNPGQESTGCSDGKEYVQNDEEFMEKNQYIGMDPTQRMKRFLWPRYRVEDLICMNRHWWNRHKRSRSVLKVRMYPKMDNWNSWENLFFLITEYTIKLIFLMHSVIKKIPFFFPTK
uniref:Protein TIC 214 n=1 Tax=Parasitaxus usta TaxID=56899 RepID=A0A5J6CE51_9CONI|nr:hypothetical protein RF1 [Parasitaxus usta]QEQ14305.1 hypothetical protein RF1 [Parasitaxus usta]